MFVVLEIVLAVLALAALDPGSIEYPGDCGRSFREE
jgi:hypothetical protein